MAPSDGTDDISRLLRQAESGDPEPAGQLLALVYDELRSLAAGIFAGQRADHTLQPTALVHEAWLKLAGNISSVADRRHFFVLASKAMRQVLTDHARGKARIKRGGRRPPGVTLDAAELTSPVAGIDPVDLEDSLCKLEQLNARHARVVELRLFGSLTIDETAEVLGLSHGTVESDWAMAKAWLRRELRETH